eukprot:3016077-Pyramimonas_sp.AAC.2
MCVPSSRSLHDLPTYRPRKSPLACGLNGGLNGGLAVRDVHKLLSVFRQRGFSPTRCVLRAERLGFGGNVRPEVTHIVDTTATSQLRGFGQPSGLTQIAEGQTPCSAER